MTPGLVIKLRPTGPWRSGPDTGARNRVDPIYHSDALYSAVCGVMARLGEMDAWLEATARNPAGSVVCFSSLFPFQEEIGFVAPPRSLWPPPLGSPKVRWKSARFVPLGLIAGLVSGQVPDETHWSVDGASQCLVPAGQPGPFRTTLRWNSAVDRLSGASERHSTACLEFRAGAGLWAVISFADEAARERWAGPVRTAMRVLADSGLGGERSRGWGHAEEPEFIEGDLPGMILPPPPAAAIPEEGAPAPESQNTTPAPGPQPPAPESAGTGYWLLSLFVPGAADAVDWSRGNYSVVTRGGRIDSPARSGELKKQLQMVAEGSVVISSEPVRGAAPDVAPDGFEHPVYRAGFALAIPLPGQVTA